MKLTVTWSDRDGEGRLSPTDRKAILETEDHILVLDFLGDAIKLMEELYRESITIGQKRYDLARKEGQQFRETRN